MHRTTRTSLGYGLLALALVALPLGGCSMAGMSSYGSNKLQVAELSNIGDYSAETALSEARAHFRNNDFGHSAALYKRVVELKPKSADGYVGLSASYDRLGRFDLADRVYAALFEIGGGTAQYYNNVGYSQMLRGNLPEAAKNLRKALAIEPANAVTANNLRILAKATA